MTLLSSAVQFTISFGFGRTGFVELLFVIFYFYNFIQQRLGSDTAMNSLPAAILDRYRKPYGDSANIKMTDMKQTFLDTITCRLTSYLTSQRFVFNFFCQRTNFLIQFLLPTHIAHICLCLPTHEPTQKQSQKSAIANAFKRQQQNFTFKTISNL